MRRAGPSAGECVTAPTPAERRWSLAGAIAAVTVFGLSIGQAAPLLSLLLEKRGIDATMNGVNAGATFVGVLVGPLLAPRGVRRLGIRDFLLVCFALDIGTFLAMGAFAGVAAWFALRMLLGVIGSCIFTAAEAWINHLAGDVGRGRIIGLYGAALSAGIGVGPLVLSITGIEGWLPFITNGVITAMATLPLLGVGNASRAFGSERGAHPFSMFARAPIILIAAAMFGLYEAALITLLPIWGVRSGLSERLAAATLSVVYVGSIAMQLAVGWLSDRVARVAALRLCGVAGLVGALLVATVVLPPPLLFCLLFVWGGVASGIYFVALSMAGDRFRGAELVSVNAAMIIAYGLGGLAGPALGGMAMDLRNPQGLLWLFALLFACLLGATCGTLRRWVSLRSTHPTTDQPPPPGSG